LPAWISLVRRRIEEERNRLLRSICVIRNRKDIGLLKMVITKMTDARSN